MAPWGAYSREIFHNLKDGIDRLKLWGKTVKKSEKVSPTENWRNIKLACFSVKTIEIAIRLKKTFKDLFFLMTCVTRDAPLDKNLLRAAILQTFPVYCCLTKVTCKMGKSS